MHNQRIRPHLGEPAGASDKAIAELEAQVGHRLPGAYREYLQWMGRDYHGVLRGSDCFIDHVPENTEYLRELLSQNNIPFSPAGDYLVWFLHQGYIASWFYLPYESENPPVHIFNEGQREKGIQTGTTFVDSLLMDMRGMSNSLS